MVSCGVESGSSKFASTWLDVDASFLGPQMPSLESKQAVSSLQGEDVLLLVSGEKIALAGLECNAKMFCYTQALFLGSEPDLEFSPATSSLNETGLKSGWCELVEQGSHSYHSRYVLLTRS
jgi:hypothetical protein